MFKIVVCSLALQPTDVTVVSCLRAVGVEAIRTGGVGGMV